VKTRFHFYEYNQIKKATLNDISVLQKVSIQTFTETFAAVNTPKILILTLQKNCEQLSKELKHPSSEFLLLF
jgi:hypothetical protein